MHIISEKMFSLDFIQAPLPMSDFNNSHLGPYIIENYVCMYGRADGLYIVMRILIYT